MNIVVLVQTTLVAVVMIVGEVTHYPSAKHKDNQSKGGKEYEDSLHRIPNDKTLERCHLGVKELRICEHGIERC